MEVSTMKAITTAMLFVILFNVAGCGKQENSDKEVRPPRVSLHVAALQGNLNAIRQHINAGSDLNAKDAYGSTPLIVAATFGKTDVARALIDAGVDMQIANNEGSTPLHIAAFFCRKDIVQLLLDAGANIKARNAAGLTPAEMVSAPFEHVKPIYDGILESLGPIGLELDYEYLRKTRPEIQALLSE